MMANDLGHGAPDDADRPHLYILLIGNYANDRQESMQRFAALMLRGLHASGLSAELLEPSRVFGRLLPSAVGIGKWLGYLDKFLLFPMLLKRKLSSITAQHSAKLVVHICDHSNAIYARFLQRTPHVVTCHDLLAVRSALGEFPANRTRLPGRILQKRILSGLSRAKHVACDSLATHGDVLRLSTLKTHQVSMIPVAQNYSYTRMSAEQAGVYLHDLLRDARGTKATQRSRFILHVGGNQWYKNRLGVLQIYAELVARMSDPPSLVMAGQSLPEAILRFIDQHQLQERVLIAVSCSNEELRALYSTAEVLLFPSLAEGFGWPVIEAQACGCPVITSSRPPMTEIGGTAAAFLDPADPRAAAQLVIQSLSLSPQERQERVEAGIRNAALFSEERMIASYLELYRRMGAAS